MSSEIATRPTKVRHIVLWLTVALYMNTYMDRVVISVAAPSIQEEFGFSLVTMGWIFAAFQISYALFQVPGGWMGDRIGPRRALSAIVFYWSIFTAATAYMWSAASFVACRFLFGAGEAGAFPIATRALSRWMLPTERGWAQGLTHAGSRTAAAATPLLVAAMIGLWGWRAPFVIFALVGLVWVAAWHWYYRDDPREHRSVNPAELTRIESVLGRGAHEGVRKKVPWKQLLGNSQLWLLSCMYFCYGYGIVTFLTWFPKYLTEARDFTLAEMGLYASVPLAAGVLGNIFGGLSSDHLVKRTSNLKVARRSIAITGFLLAGSMVPLAAVSANPLISVLFFAVAVFGLEMTVSCSWAVTLDIGGEFAGSVASVMNTFGNTGGAIAAALMGYIVTWFDWQTAFFVLAGFALLAAVLFTRIDASRRIYDDSDLEKAVAAPAYATQAE
jgi:MFS transporter, ACS family, glucarate transporter